MKKTLLILAALTAFVSCYKEEPVIDTDPVEINPENIVFNVTVGDLGPDTKSVKTSWKKGDIIWAWVDGNYNKTRDLEITYDGEKWIVALFRPGCTFKDGGKIAAFFEGNNNINRYEFSEDFFETSTGMGLESKVVLDTRDGQTCYQYPMIAACESTYSYDRATSNPATSMVTINLNNWEFLTSIQVVIPGLDASEAANYTLTCPQLSPLFRFGVSNQGTIMANRETWTGKSPVGGVLNEAGEVAFYFFGPKTSKTTNYNFCLKHYNYMGTILYGEYYYYAQDKKLTADGTKCLSISIPLIKFHEAKQTKGKGDVKSGGHRPDCSWVQLWENGPKFAEFNVGSYIESYDKTVRNPDAANGSVKYYNMDNVGGLYPRNNPYYNARESQYWYANECGDPNKDIATELWGSDWRTISPSDIKELIGDVNVARGQMFNSKHNLTWRWVTDYLLGDLAGMTITGELGTEWENTLFFPAAGYYYQYHFYLYESGEHGYYWVTDEAGENRNIFYVSEIQSFLDTEYIYDGKSVRAVYKK